MPGGIIVPEQATPSTPAAGYSIIYPKADGLWYFKDDAGVEHVFSTNGIAETIFDAKGDLIVATAADTPSRLAVGADDSFLKASAAQAKGMLWSALTPGSQTVAGVWEAATQAEADAGTPSRVPTTDLFKINLQTLITTAADAAKVFAAVPSGTRRITMSYAGVSTNGTTGWNFQLGTGGAPTTSGYVGVVTSVNHGSSPNGSNISAGFNPGSGGSAAHISSGILVAVLHDPVNHIWACHWLGAVSNVPVTYIGAGYIDLAGECNYARIITSNGTDTFDAGSVNISYER